MRPHVPESSPPDGPTAPPLPPPPQPPPPPMHVAPVGSAPAAPRADAARFVPAAVAQASAAAAFFARAAQKLNLSMSHRRKRQSAAEEAEAAAGGGGGGGGEMGACSNFCTALRRYPPPLPPALLRRIGLREVTGVGKVKVMLRVSREVQAANASGKAGASAGASAAAGPAGAVGAVGSAGAAGSGGSFVAAGASGAAVTAAAAGATGVTVRTAATAAASGSSEAAGGLRTSGSCGSAEASVGADGAGSPEPPSPTRASGDGEEGGAGGSGSPCAPPADAAGAAAGAAAFFSVDARKKQVTLFEPSSCGGLAAPEDRRVGVAAPKMFAFDAIFSQDDSQTEVCSSALVDVIHAVINGADGCLFCFGHARLGKTYTMLGSPESMNALGVIPCAISWLFRCIHEQKQKTGARFSVRVSAVEVVGASQLRDLLADYVSDAEQSPGVYLRDDPLFGTQLQNHSELRVPSVEKAAFYLDAAINSRAADGEARGAHFLYTLHVYQYSVGSKGGVAGGRSRLHLIDLGSCERGERGKAASGIPLSGLGNVLLAIFNGQKHLPYREHKITQLLKECLSSLTCHAAMIAHVSPYAQHYTDTLAIVQLASRIHRMRRRKIKLWGGSAGSGGSSGEEVNRLQIQENGCSTSSSDVDPSSSEQSADTVIYVGPSDDATDGEHPPVYIPSLNSGDNRCAMGKALQGSCAEHRSFFSYPRNHLEKSIQGECQKGTTLCKTLSGNSEEGSNYSCRSSPCKATTQSSACKSGLHAFQNSSKTSSVRVQNKIVVNKSPGNLNDHALGGKTSKLYNSTSSGIISGSDEQWIDGPRISKSKVAEARSLLKDHHNKKETWVDGPMQLMKEQSGVNYGYMDNHKKNMIRKWVENQTVQIQQNTKQTPKIVSTGHYSCGQVGQVGQVLSAKDTLISKTNDYDLGELELPKCHLIYEANLGSVDANVPSKQSTSSFINDAERIKHKHFTSYSECDERDVFSEIVNHSLPFTNELDSDIPLEIKGEKKCEDLCENVERNISKEDWRNQPVDISSVPQYIELNMGVSTSSFDEKLQVFHEKHMLGSSMDDNEIEIIEVEEPREPVPTQDNCLQVTEEDIALSMGNLENPPSVDQLSCGSHPLQNLSQENLTVVSTFTDSSSTTDLERTLHDHHIGVTLDSECTFQPSYHYCLYEMPEDYASPLDIDLCRSPLKRNTQVENDIQELLFPKNRTHQLTKLQELYKNKFTKTRAPTETESTLESNQYHTPTRYQSLSLFDMFRSLEYSDRSNRIGFGCNSSIYSEPTCNVNNVRRDQFKMCDNCRVKLRKTADDCISYIPSLSQNRDELKSVPQDKDPYFSLDYKMPIDSCCISSLRHPDGASNPNLREEEERESRNGVSTYSYEEVAHDKQFLQNKRKALGKEKESKPFPMLPTPFITPSTSRLHRKLFSKTCAGLKHIGGTEEYDSGHDSTSSRLAKGSPFLQRFSKSRPGCGSSGYESVVRDSESSSFGSSQDSDHGSHSEFHDTGRLDTSSGASRSTNIYLSSNEVPVLQYSREDIERLERRWLEVQGVKVRQLKEEQEELKEELAKAKSRLLIPPSRWSYELHVVANMDQRNPSFLEALQRETEILRKRVQACKSHILIVTCFDSLPKGESPAPGGTKSKEVQDIKGELHSMLFRKLERKL